MKPAGSGKTLKRMVCAALCAMTLGGITAFAEARADDTGDDRIKITLIASNEGDEAWRQVRAGASTKAAELKNVDLTFRAPADNADASAQLKLLEDATTAKADVILIAPLAGDAIAPGVEKAKAAGIKVVMVGTVTSGAKYDASVTTDYPLMAKTAADTLARLVGEKGRIAIINGKADAETMKILENDFERQVRKQYPDVEIVAVQYANGDAAKARIQALDVIEANPDIAGFYGCDESSTVGIAQAIVKSGAKGRIKAVGVGLTGATKALLGQKSVQAIMAQDPYRIGYEALDAGIRALRGEALAGKKISVGVKVVTEDNPGATR